MRLLLKYAFTFVVIMFSMSALAAGLKIKEKYDDFTRETYLEAKAFSVCQSKNAGMMAACGTFQLRWSQATPDVVYMNIGVGGSYVSMTEIFFNIDGEISGFDASDPITNHEYDESIGVSDSSLRKRSSNSFEVPVAILKSVVESSESRIVRVAGTDHVADYDFGRKHMFKLPFKLLNDFVERVESTSQPEPPE